MSRLEEFYNKVKEDPALKAELDVMEKGYAGHPERSVLIAKATIAIAERNGVLLNESDFDFPFLDSELEDVQGGGVAPALPTIIPRLF